MKVGNIYLESGHGLLIWTRKSKHFRWYYRSKATDTALEKSIEDLKDAGMGSLIRALDTVLTRHTQTLTVLLETFRL
jgi:hypothetical protein